MNYLSSSGILNVILFLCICSICLLLSVFLANKYQTRREIRRARQNIHDILQQGMDKRCHFDVHFPKIDVEADSQSSQGTCIALDNPFTLPTAKQALITLAFHSALFDFALKGQDIDVFFHFKQDEQLHFYHFMSVVLDIRKKDEAFLVQLAFPLELDNQQRRNFVRIKVSTDDLPRFGLWHGIQVYSSGMRNTNRDAARDPDVVVMPHLLWKVVPTESVMFMDISAGGLSLQVSPSERYPGLAIGEMLTMHIGLPPVPAGREADLGATVELLISGVIVRNIPRAGSSASFGLRFQRWAYSVHNVTPVWFIIKENDGILPLGNWIMRLQVYRAHLQQQRQNPQNFLDATPSA